MTEIQRNKLKLQNRKVSAISQIGSPPWGCKVTLNSALGENGYKYSIFHNATFLSCILLSDSVCLLSIKYPILSNNTSNISLQYNN